MRFGTVALATGFTVLLTWLHYHGTDLAARVQDVMTVILMGASLGFIAAGLLAGSAGNLEPVFVLRETGWRWAGLATVLVATPFFYGGFNMAVQAIGERAPGVTVRAVGLALFAAIACSGAFYVLVIVSGSLAAPREVLLGADLPAVAAFEAAFDSRLLARVVLFAGLLGLLTSWNSVIFACAGVLFVLGDHGHLPAAFARTHPRHGTPSVALVLIGVLTVGGVFGGTGALGIIIGSASMTFSAAYLIVGIAAVVLARRAGETGGTLVRGAAILAASFVLCIGVAEPFMARPEPHLPVSWAALGLWLALGVIVWLTVAGREPGKAAATPGSVPPGGASAACGRVRDG